MKPEQDVVTMELDKNSPEYGDVSGKFYTTAVGATITKIDRVQNPFRYRSYMLRKQKMDKDNGGTNERQLFHGTSDESTKAINTQGFNRSFCGKHGEYRINSSMPSLQEHVYQKILKLRCSEMVFPAISVIYLLRS